MNLRTIRIAYTPRSAKVQRFEIYAGQKHVFWHWAASKYKNKHQSEFQFFRQSSQWNWKVFIQDKILKHIDRLFLSIHSFSEHFSTGKSLGDTQNGFSVETRKIWPMQVFVETEFSDSAPRHSCFQIFTFLNFWMDENSRFTSHKWKKPWK